LFPLQFFSPGPCPLFTPAAGWFAGLIVLPTIAAFGIYTLGLRWLSASVAAIVATSEVVFASIFAYLLLSERLDLVQVVGAAMVISGVALLSLSSQRLQKRKAAVPALYKEEKEPAPGSD